LRGYGLCNGDVVESGLVSGLAVRSTLSTMCPYTSCKLDDSHLTLFPRRTLYQHEREVQKHDEDGYSSYEERKCKVRATLRDCMHEKRRKERWSREKAVLQLRYPNPFEQIMDANTVVTDFFVPVVRRLMWRHDWSPSFFSCEEP